MFRWQSRGQRQRGRQLEFFHEIAHSKLEGRGDLEEIQN